MEEIFLLIAWKFWMQAYIVCLLSVSIGNSARLGHPGLGLPSSVSQSAVAVLAELWWNVSGCHETSAQQQVPVAHSKICLLSSLLSKETAIFLKHP